MDLGQALWQLRIATECLDSKDSEELIECYKYAYAVRYLAFNEQGVSETEKRCAAHLFEDVEAEMERRHMTAIGILVVIDDKGNFVTGREDLKEMWSEVSFEEMLSVGDKMLESCVTEEQRQAIIELQREVVTKAN